MVWWFYDELLDSKIYQDVGRNYKNNDKVEETFEIEHGCYHQFLFNQTDTNIATEDSFSWHKVELNGQTITHGTYRLDVNGRYIGIMDIHDYFGFVLMYEILVNHTQPTTERSDCDDTPDPYVYRQQL